MPGSGITGAMPLRITSRAMASSSPRAESDPAVGKIHSVVAGTATRNTRSVAATALTTRITHPGTRSAVAAQVNPAPSTTAPMTTTSQGIPPIDSRNRRATRARAKAMPANPASQLTR